MLNGVPSPERHPFSSDAYSGNPAHSDLIFDEMPLVDREFEQLSAYLDGELSPQEARAVEDWIAAEPRAKKLYSNLSSIQASFDPIHRPTADSTEIDRMAEQVFTLADSPQPGSVRHLPHMPMICQKVAAILVLALGSGLSTWQWRSPQPLISMEDPPVTISGLPPSARMAERYLLDPPASQDPYSILFVEADL